MQTSFQHTQFLESGTHGRAIDSILFALAANTAGLFGYKWIVICLHIKLLDI